MDERAWPRRFFPLPLLVSLVLLYWCPSIEASSSLFDQSIIETVFWNAVGVIKIIRHGPDDDMEDLYSDASNDNHRSLLTDPDFLYRTLYREEEEVEEEERDSVGDGGERSVPTMATSFHGNLLRVLDILEIEHRLRRLRQADQRAVIEETINESSIATPSVVGGETMGGAVGGCNMAAETDASSTETAAAESDTSGNAACSIQRSKRQVEELEPYVPYLGFVFYSFPIFSFTLPFGGQLKLFGYDFI